VPEGGWGLACIVPVIIRAAINSGAMNCSSADTLSRKLSSCTNQPSSWMQGYQLVAIDWHRLNLLKVMALGHPSHWITAVRSLVNLAEGASGPPLVNGLRWTKWIL
jgi:hypothetical protein